MRKLIVKIAAVVSTILFGFMICVTVITSENRTAVNNYFNVQDFKVVVPDGVSTEDTEYFESRFENLASLIEAGRATAEEVEADLVFEALFRLSIPLTAEEARRRRFNLCRPSLRKRASNTRN